MPRVQLADTTPLVLAALHAILGNLAQQQDVLAGIAASAASSQLAAPPFVEALRPVLADALAAVVPPFLQQAIEQGAPSSAGTAEAAGGGGAAASPGPPGSTEQAGAAKAAGAEGPPKGGYRPYRDVRLTGWVPGQAAGSTVPKAHAWVAEAAAARMERAQRGTRSPRRARSRGRAFVSVPAVLVSRTASEAARAARMAAQQVAHQVQPAGCGGAGELEHALEALG